VNIVGLLNLLVGARAGGVKRVVFASSGGTVYGEGEKLPFSEPDPKLPTSPYGTAKLASEYYLATFSQLYGIEAAVLRYSNVYGPRQNPHGEAGVIAIFSSRIASGQAITIFGDGGQTRDMVYALDVAEANVRAAGVALPKLTSLDARAWNIGTGMETSVNRLAELLAAGAGKNANIKRAPARAGEILRSSLATDKAARELGWRPRTPLAEGLRATIRSIMEA
jgi:UDP-glucose 4-epimerase